MEKIDFDRIVDRVLRQYMATALWSSTTGENGEIHLDEAAEQDGVEWSEDAAERARRDCADLVRDNWDLVVEMDGEEQGQVGHDFWLTRNMHGAGFWDGDWPKEIGERLTAYANTKGEVYIDLIGDRIEMM